VILGSTGRNFAAGMSGGVAYVYDPTAELPDHLNPEMVELEEPDDDDFEWLHQMLTKHVDATGSVPGTRILWHWATERRQFVKVMPRDYKRVLEAMAAAEQNGTDVDAAIMAAAHG
jgi:glutamate synthase (NADPH) large chain